DSGPGPHEPGEGAARAPRRTAGPHLPAAGLPLPSSVSDCEGRIVRRGRAPPSRAQAWPFRGVSSRGLGGGNRRHANSAAATPTVATTTDATTRRTRGQSTTGGARVPNDTISPLAVDPPAVTTPRNS